MAESPYKALSLSLIHQGKVRDIYDIDEHHMLIVATDRLSAFDVIFDQPIPDKGKILTSIANFWFDKTSHIIQNHLTELSLTETLSAAEAEALDGRGRISPGEAREIAKRGHAHATRSRRNLYVRGTFGSA